MHCLTVVHLGALLCLAVPSLSLKVTLWQIGPESHSLRGGGAVNKEID